MIGSQFPETKSEDFWKAESTIQFTQADLCFFKNSFVTLSQVHWQLQNYTKMALSLDLFGLVKLYYL